MVSLKNAAKTARKNSSGLVVVLGQDDSYDKMKDFSGDMPTSVPNFLVKTYEIVNVS